MVALAALLTRSMNDRRAVNAAYSDVSRCGPGLPRDVQTFQAAGASHRQLLGELAQMPGTPALPPAMVRDLARAWRASARADDDLAKWAQDQVTDGCSPASQRDPHYVAAGRPDTEATMSKKAFLRWWDPLAQAYGLKTYTQSDL